MLTLVVAALTLTPFTQELRLRVPRVGPDSPQYAGSNAQAWPRGEVRPAVRRNIVLILADDFGVDLVGAYGEGANPPCTPNLDALAQDGILFRNAWANPICSPTRATTLTGRYAFRHGFGSVGGGMNSPGLSLLETTLPEALPGFSSAALGKWHVQGSQGPTHPNDSGFWYYAGGLGGGVGDYFDWSKTIDGVSSNVTTYATSDTADEAILAAETLPQPFFLYVAFNAPHSPFHVPPAELCDPPGACACDSLGTNPSNTERGKAMVEAMDHELGRMLAGIRAVAPDPLVVFIGDNGTPRALTEPPFDNNRAKGSMYEGGVNVPFIVAGAGVAQGECQGLVGVNDLHATFAEWVGATSEAEDSVSLVPYFLDPLRPSLRETVFTQTFTPNGDGPYTENDRAVRNARYKLIRRIGEPDELYDLDQDPFEDTDLVPTLVPGTDAHDNYLALVQALVDLGQD